MHHWGLFDTKPWPSSRRPQQLFEPAKKESTTRARRREQRCAHPFQSCELCNCRLTGSVIHIDFKKCHLRKAFWRDCTSALFKCHSVYLERAALPHVWAYVYCKQHGSVLVWIIPFCLTTRWVNESNLISILFRFTVTLQLDLNEMVLCLAL